MVLEIYKLIMETKLYKRVKLLMEVIPQLRDDDTRLFQAIRREDVANEGYVFNAITGNFLDMLEQEGKISNKDSVTRNRRRIEERYPELRGSTWEKRQKRGVEVAIEIIEGK